MTTGIKTMEDGIMKKTLCIAASLLALAACTREVNIEDPANEVTLIARTETSAESRTVVEGETHVYWEPEDEIKVFQPGKAGRFSTDITTASATAAFTGMMELTEGTDIWAVYPYSDNASFSNGTITTVLPSEQVSRAGSFGKDMNLAVAHSATPELQFFNVGGGVRFSLSQEGIREVVLQGLNGETLAGKVQIAFQDDIPAIQGVTEEKTSITLTPADGGTFLTDTWYFIVAIPGALENGFKLSFRKADAQGTRVVNKAVTVTRGIYGTLTHADEGVTFNPVSDDNIIFKDDLVKSILVQHFDTNEDGEISYQEAATVPSLHVEGMETRADEAVYTVFTRTDITSFDELVYFTGLTQLEPGAFAQCLQLTSITIPENVSYIGDVAIYACPLLQSITMTSPVPATLGQMALDYTGDCPIEVPAESVDAYVTAWSEYAPRIVPLVPNNMIWYTSTDGQIVTPCNYDPTGAGRFPDPRDVFGVGIVSNTYADGKGVIVFDGKVTAIGDNAFYYCSNLASIELPKSVDGIGTAAFAGCANLTSVALPEGLVSIGNAAFRRCSSLESIVIPGSVTSIGEKAFSGCPGLTSMEVKSNNTVYISERCDAIFEKSTLTLIAGCASTYIPDGVAAIGDYAFQGCAAPSSLTLPSSVKKIGNCAFDECAGLEYLQIPGSVKQFGHHAFYNCPDLDYVSVEEGVTSLGDYAFSECAKLGTVNLPVSLTEIGTAAFAFCSSLEGVDMPAVETVGTGAFAYCTAMKSVSLWANCTSIGEYAFLDCSALQIIVVVASTPPTGGDGMFDGSTCLIYVPDTSWGAYQTADKWHDYELRIRPIGGGNTVPEPVDLGLPSGLKWAPWNVGASQPEQFGYYYAWGETAPKFYYYVNTYKWCMGEEWTITKYNGQDYAGVVDNKFELDPGDDAAHVNWREKWRMPTSAEMMELQSMCTWVWTTLNGVNGFRITGLNGNSIFLPAAGARMVNKHGVPPDAVYFPVYRNLGIGGGYWTKSLYERNYLIPLQLDFYFDTLDSGTADYTRYDGLTVRPVWDDSIE